MPILEAEYLRSLPRAVVVGHVHDLAFAEMVSTAVRTKLRHLVAEIRKQPRFKVPPQAVAQRIVRVVVAEVCSVFTAQGPVGGNSKLLADRFRSPLDECLFADVDIDMPC